jgi:hypothetical protein
MFHFNLYARNAELMISPCSPYVLLSPANNFDPTATECGLDAILLIPQLQPFQNGERQIFEVEARL